MLEYGDNICVSQPYVAVPNEQKVNQSFANVGSSVYIIGGSDSNYTTAVDSKNISCYNVLNGSLVTKTTKLPMPLVFSFCAAVGTKIYIFGGRETVNVYQSYYNYNTNAYLGDNNIAQLTNAYLYDSKDLKWKSLSGESYVADMQNALNILGVN